MKNGIREHLTRLYLKLSFNVPTYFDEIDAEVLRFSNGHECEVLWSMCCMWYCTCVSYVPKLLCEVQ